jgi:hypothetical protein
VGNIFEQLWSPYYDNRFLPIASALLHFQSLNLYNDVRLSHRHLVLKFCVTIIQSRSNVGEMVKQLHFGRGSEREEDIYKGMQFANSDMDQLLRSMFPQLIHLEILRIWSPLIAQSVFTSFDTTPPPSSLFLLDLELNNYSLIDQILPISLASAAPHRGLP